MLVAVIAHDCVSQVESESTHAIRVELASVIVHNFHTLQYSTKHE